MKVKRKSIISKSLFALGMLFGSFAAVKFVSPSAVYSVDALNVNETFLDSTSKIFFKVTSLGDVNTVEAFNLSPQHSSTDLEIPSTVTYNNVEYRVTCIGESSFTNSSTVTNVIIPNTIANIGNAAFNSALIKTCRVKSRVPCNIGYNVFRSSVNLTVPKGATNAYKNNASWLPYIGPINEASETIEDFLPEDFPTTKRTAWVDSKGNCLYQDDYSVIFSNDNATFALNKTVDLTKELDKYVYSPTSSLRVGLILRVHDLYQIEFTNAEKSSLNGQYSRLTYDKFYLCGNINGSDCGINADSAKVKSEYKFNENGKLSVVFEKDSFVTVKIPNRIYYFEAEQTDGSGAVVDYDKGYSELMRVPAGTPYLFTLLDNENGSFTLSYEVHKVNVSVTTSSFGTLSQDFSESVLVGTEYSVDGNKITIGETEIVATPNRGSEFNKWKVGTSFVTEGGTLTKDTTFEATYNTKSFTLKEIMPEDFPTTKEAGWKNEHGEKLYYSNNTLYINDNVLTPGFNDQYKIYYNKTYDAYVYSEFLGGTIYVIFDVNDNTGVFESVRIAFDPDIEQSTIKGTYVSPLLDSKSDLEIIEDAELTYSNSDGVATLDLAYEDYQVTMELYYDSSEDKIPAGTYTINDSQEAATVLRSSGIIEDIPQKSYAVLVDGSGKIKECWLLVDGFVTVEYDNLNRLIVTVDAKNTNEKVIKCTGIYVPSYTVSVEAASNGSISSAYSKTLKTGTAYSIDGNKLTIGEDEITATANDGYEFDSWMIGETKVSENGTITSDVSFKATFKIVNPGDNNGLSGGAIAGITVGSIAATSLISYIVMFVIWKKKGNAFKFLVRSFEWINKLIGK